MTHAPAPIDYSLLDPGILRLVRWLRSKGYETTDSGDGNHALSVPHVFIASSRARLAAEADDLMADLAAVGIALEVQSEEGDGPSIQAMYDPADGSCILALFGVTDAMLPPPAN